MAARSPLLELESVYKSFPGVQALREVSFSLFPGEVHVLVGENGAGKSTLIKIISGAHQPDKAAMRLDGRPAVIRSPQQALSLGISTIYQEFNLIPHLTVAQNIFLGSEPLRSVITRALDHRWMHEESRSLLDSLEIDIPTNALVADLGVAQQQMVEVAKALRRRIRILIMDEPTSALMRHEVAQLFSLMRRLKESGIGIIYISHHLDEVFEVGDRVTVLRDGRWVATCPTAQIDADELVRMMTGRTVTQLFPRDVNPSGQEVLRVQNLGQGRFLRDVNLTVRAGEIVGLAGLVGSGRTTLARVLYGVDGYDRGQITLFGKPLAHHRPPSSIAMQMGLLPEDRKTDGLAGLLPIRDNVIHASMHRLFPWGVIPPGRDGAIANGYRQQLRIATPSVNRLVKFLSGGNQQKVVLAKWLCSQSRFLIFDEPTRGIDVGAKAEIHSLMNDLAKQGIAILMISSELPEILGMSDRIYIMREGRVVKEFPRGQTTQEEIMRYAMGLDG